MLSHSIHFLQTFHNFHSIEIVAENVICFFCSFIAMTILNSCNFPRFWFSRFYQGCWIDSGFNFDSANGVSQRRLVDGHGDLGQGRLLHLLGLDCHLSCFDVLHRVSEKLRQIFGQRVSLEYHSAKNSRVDSVFIRNWFVFLLVRLFRASMEHPPIVGRPFDATISGRKGSTHRLTAPLERRTTTDRSIRRNTTNSLQTAEIQSILTVEAPFRLHTDVCRRAYRLPSKHQWWMTRTIKAIRINWIQSITRSMATQGDERSICWKNLLLISFLCPQMWYVQSTAPARPFPLERNELPQPQRARRPRPSQWWHSLELQPCRHPELPSEPHETAHSSARANHDVCLTEN